MKEFNVIFWDINRRKFIPYDIMPYLRKVYSEARVKPKTLNELANINGFGKVKCEKYGSDIIDIVKKYN